ncbi:hypothetical protein GCM10017691_21030 [Pseudonocardia petroleophila]|uniref:Copper resistance protein CopC n=2 Tax=Pseudonocardia petroleophila TaxID=37331 RepID=A0A7G7MGL1_9PSEU|nr:copper resistance CopC family protein [Pseudonocardia petroleophila]QNG51922.1 copper resistance protein CopC [Pseudonocardia petroleophila]
MARRRVVDAATGRVPVGVAPRAVLAALIIYALMVLSGGPALAHSELVSSDPVDGGSVVGVDRPVTLVFGEAIDASSVSIRLIGSAGFQAQLVPPTVTSTQVVQPLPTLLNDQYILRYGATAFDGHPVRGTVTFTVSGSVAGDINGPDMRHPGPHAGMAGSSEPSASNDRPSVPIWAWLGGDCPTNGVTGPTRRAQLGGGISNDRDDRACAGSD